MLVPAEVWTVAKADQGHAVLVRPVGLDVAVPIFIAPLEAQSILIGLGSVRMPRPLTHDLFLAALENLGAVINRIEITRIKEQTYYANLILEASGSEITIDARPSDCLALAVRVKCPIFIDEAIVDDAGIPVKMVEERTRALKQQDGTGQEEGAAESPDVPELSAIGMETELTTLKKVLEKAIEEEDYEEAARLRDKIRDLEST
jgi:uncharacterized protein